MKKFLLLISFVLFGLLFKVNAQVVICDFESTLGAGPVIIGGNLNQTATIVANPAPDAINSSANVLKTNVYAIGGDPAGNKIDAVMFKFPEGVSFKSVDYEAIKVNIYVTGGTSSILKPRGKAGVWVDDATSPAPGVWIGVVKNLVDGEDGLASGQSGWMECYFDISAKTGTDDYNAIQLQIDWQDERPDDLEIYFDDFVLVEAIPTGIKDEELNQTEIYNQNNTIRISGVNAQKVQVLDMTGRLVKQQQGIDLTSMNVSDLMKGIYIVQVEADGKYYSSKILVE